MINGITYWRLSSGPLAGYWLAQSETAYRRGFLGTLEFDARPRVDLRSGTYTGYRYDRYGRVLSTVRARVSSTTTFHVRAWSVINGQPHFLVSTGTWDGTWLPETAATKLRV
jgi:hypothetical protein